MQNNKNYYSTIKLHHFTKYIPQKYTVEPCKSKNRNDPQALWYFSPFLYIFSMMNFETLKTLLLVIKNTWTQFLCVIFFFHAWFIQSVRCSDKTISSFENYSWSQKTRKWNKSGIIHPLFNGLLYVIRGHFAHRIYFSSFLQGLEKYYASQKKYPCISCVKIN